MQRFVVGKLLFDEHNVVMREARDSAAGDTVILVEIHATESITLRKAILETDLHRRLTHPYIARLLAVDLKQTATGSWVVQFAKEHCSHNLSREIRMRRGENRLWQESELLKIANNLISALAEIQQIGAVVHRIDSTGLLIRRNGDVVLGSFENAIYTDDRSAIAKCMEKLAVILTQMAVLNTEELSSRDGLALILRTDFTQYKRLYALINKMRGDSQQDFVSLRDWKPQEEAKFTSESLPLEKREVEVPPVLHQTLPQSRKCLACTRDFLTPSFDPGRLREQYRKYPLYIQGVCSIRCLDTYIKYCETMELQCIMCRGRYRIEGEWRKLGNEEMADRVCSEICLQRLFAERWRR